MDGQEVKVLPPEHEYESVEKESRAESRGTGAVAGKVLCIFLSAIAVLFFTSTAVAVAGKLGISGIYMTRLLLGEFVGGARNVSVFTPAGESLTEENENDSGMPPSQSIVSPQEHPREDFSIALTNETPYFPDMNEILARPRSIPTLREIYSEYGNDAPVVLILHTHGCEGYASSASTEYRTSDKTQNIVSIGKIIANRLNSAGINTIHCDTLFDADDFNMAYYNASLTIRRTIEKYPSVSYIIDVHRDSVMLSDGTYLPLTTELNEKNAARLMFVIGTDHGGSGHTGWEDNLSLAARIQYRVWCESHHMMRSIDLRSASFNEQYTKGSLLLEVGSCANTLEEAKISAEIFADALIREIIGSDSLAEH